MQEDQFSRPALATTYRSMVIYFMSGTGNSFKVATWMEDNAVQYGIQSKLYQIPSPAEKSKPREPKQADRIPQEENIQEESKQLVGIVFPPHGFTAPWQVIRQALRLRSGRGKHAFVVATRAGTRIRSIPFPGLEGTAAYLIALILLFKGYRVCGVMGLDMPSNWMSLHWGLNPENARYIINRARVKTDSFIDGVLKGNKVYKGLVPLLLGLILLPCSLGYLVIGRFFLSKLFFASGKCTGCGLCAKNCPVQAIRMTGSKKPRPYWTFACESCLRCMGYCPRQAVEASHSFAVIIYFVATLPVSFYVLKGLNELLSLDNNLNFLKYVLDYNYMLLSLFIAYGILFWLIKIPLFNKLFTYTTLTHWYRRYHEPDTTPKDMMNCKE